MADSSVKDGGPAFPGQWIDVDSMGDRVVRESFLGMSLRDYFAAAVEVTEADFPNSYLVSEKLIGRECPAQDSDPIGWLKWIADVEALIRGIKADAMLAERAK